MKIDKFKSIANGPELPASLDSNNPKAIESYLLSLLVHAAQVEANENSKIVDIRLREDVFKFVIRDTGEFSGTLTVPVNLSAISLA